MPLKVDMHILGRKPLKELDLTISQAHLSSIDDAMMKVDYFSHKFCTFI